MSQLSFMLHGAKKIAGDNKSSTFKLKNGHSLRVSHAGLTPDKRKAIMEMPLHADAGADIGSPDAEDSDTGDVSEPPSPTPSPAPTGHYNPAINAITTQQVNQQEMSDLLAPPKVGTGAVDPNTINATPTPSPDSETPSASDIPNDQAAGTQWGYRI